LPLYNLIFWLFRWNEMKTLRSLVWPTLG